MIKFDDRLAHRQWSPKLFAYSSSSGNLGLCLGFVEMGQAIELTVFHIKKCMFLKLNKALILYCLL